MLRQNATPVTFPMSTRTDVGSIMSSGRAGKVVPVAYMPLLRGDSASGNISIDIDLAEMPRPLLNGVLYNVQAWFVPKSAHPQFAGYDEFLHSYNQQPINALDQAQRDPPAFFPHIPGVFADSAWGENAEFFTTLGLHFPPLVGPSTDINDAFNLIYNFRLAAHSSKLGRRAYAMEDPNEAGSLPPAFWPEGPFRHVVPDYERALITGPVNIDVATGQVRVANLLGSQSAGGPVNLQDADGNVVNTTYVGLFAESAGLEGGFDVHVDLAESFSLADIEKAKQTKAFANLRASYAGNDATGFDNDEAILADLMQGFNVPEDHFKRPWLLDAVRLPFGMAERHATDAANLDASVSKGVGQATLALNVPKQDTGGVIMVTVEVVPERIYEAAMDEWLLFHNPSSLPNALRDVQRTEAVDYVSNLHIDARHGDALGAYGYEAMNEKWNRENTRMGGVFFQPDPSNPFTEQRAGVWQAGVVDPEFTQDHWLCPEDFPHDVFSDPTAPAFEFVARHSLTIRGLTQFGDPVVENNDEYDLTRVGAGT